MHPDLGGEHEKAALVNEAFAVLSDPELRAEYDESFRAEEGTDHDTATRSKQRQGGAGATQEGATDSTGEDAGNSSQLRSDEQCLFCLARCQSIQFRGPDDVCSNCGSPIYPAKQRRFEVDCQRAIARIPKRAPATFSVSWPEVSQLSGWVSHLVECSLELTTS